MDLRNALAVLMVGSFMLGGCGPVAPPRPPMPTAEGREASGSAVTDALQRQQAAAGAQAAARAARRRAVVQPGEGIWLQTGKSRVIELSHRVKRVSVGNPDVAGVVVLGPHTVLVNARSGSSEGGMASPMPAAAPASSGFGGTSLNVQIGQTNRTQTTKLDVPTINETTLVFWGPDDRPDTHSLVVADFLGEQVMLEVTVAELNRTAMEEHGIDFRQIGTSFVSAYFMGGGLGSAIPGIATTVPPIGTPLLPLTLGTENPNFVFQLPKDDITAFVKLLQTEGMASVLAQPTILAMSGQKALFQVGGEIPIRISTGFVADIEFKPFGTIVAFLPQVTDDGDIVLTVAPEVSAPDFTQTVEDVPTFRTRRASTSVKLRDGETLALGGLLQKVRRETVRGVPYLQDIPVLGYIFRDTSYADEDTELLVIVTPRLVTPVAPGATYALPTDYGPLTNEDIRTKANGAEVTRPRIPGLR